ncbi:MAG: hypothetical protein ABII64_08325 [Elusimicrobiota bacterium]
MNQTVANPATKTTAGEMREKWSEFLFWLSVFFGALHFGVIAGGLAGFAVQSSFLMGNIYLGVLAAYVGQKELRRWLSAPDADVMPEDVLKKFARGEIIVTVWAVTAGVVVLFWEFGLVRAVPETLLYTFGEVMGIYFGTSASKYFKNRGYKAAMETESVAATYGDKVLAFVSEHGEICNNDCEKLTGLNDSQTYRLLTKLVEEKKLKAAGLGKGRKYTLA